MIGSIIRQLRTEEGLTQTELGKKLGYNQHQISKWETGFLEPDIEAIKKLAVFFHVTSDFLIGLENQTGCKIEYSEEFTYTDGTHSIKHKKKK